jgi:signal transduction histidine kinase
VLLLLTPVRVPRDDWGAAEGFTQVPGDAAISTLMAFAGMSVVAGILLGRHDRRLALALVCWPFATVLLTGTFVWGWGLGLLALAALGAQESWRRAALPFALLMTVVVAYCFSGVPAMLPVGLVDAGAATPDEALLAVLLYSLPITAGLAGVRALAATRDARHAAARAARDTHEVLLTGAVTAERARLARDLHDVVAHHISLIAVRAEAAPYVHPDLDERAREVLAGVATDARQALDELRQVLTVLRRSEDVARAPQPGAAEVPALVEAARAAGQRIEVTGAIGTAQVPAATGYVLYRVAQEALTNARRHAPGAPVEVDLADGPDGWVLRVRNPLAEDDSEPLVPGRGVVGMRERVEALGGTLEVTGTDGEVVVRASLPRTTGPVPVAAAAVPA